MRCDNRGYQDRVDGSSLIELCTHRKRAYEVLRNIIDCSRETLDRSVSALSNDKSIASQNAGDRDPNSNSIASEVDHVIEAVSELIADLLREMRCCDEREVAIDPRE